jgi:heptosyltransferase-2
VKPVNPPGGGGLLWARPRFRGYVGHPLPRREPARAACPGAKVGYVVERPLAPLLAGDPRVDEVIGVSAKPSAAETFALARRLRAFRADVLFDCFCNPRTAIWSFASGAPVRVGYPNKGWRSALYTHHARPRTLSATGFHLASLAALGWPAPAAPPPPRLHVGEAARAEAAASLRALGVPDGSTLAGFHPGARWPTRRWAPERFVALASRALASRPGTVALFTAGPGEEPLVRECVAALPAGRAFAIERWPLARFVALQSLCAAFTCGDTGPLHTAVASGARTLGLMSRNRPAMFFPYPESAGHRAFWARVECSPCHRDECADLRCLARLTVDGAWALLEPMLAAGVPDAARPGSP